MSSQLDSEMQRYLSYLSMHFGQCGPTKFGGLSGSSSGPVPSAMFNSLRVSIVCESITGFFSLSELVFLVSLKILGLNSRSPAAWTHSSKSEEDPDHVPFSVKWVQPFSLYQS